MFAHSPLNFRPLVACNLVMSLDGQLADASGRAQGIGSNTDRCVMDVLRARADAILTTGATVRADNPFLHVRQAFALAHRRTMGLLGQPRRIILSSSADLPPDARCLAPAPDSTLWERPVVVVGSQAHIDPRWPPTEVWRLTPDAAALPKLLRRLYDTGVRRLLVEAGGSLLTALAQAHCLDIFFLTLAPKLLGAKNRKSGLGFITTRAPKFSLVSTRAVEDEIFSMYVRRALPHQTPNDPVQAWGQSLDQILAVADREVKRIGNDKTATDP